MPEREAAARAALALAVADDAAPEADLEGGRNPRNGLSELPGARETPVRFVALLPVRDAVPERVVVGGRVTPERATAAAAAALAALARVAAVDDGVLLPRITSGLSFEGRICEYRDVLGRLVLRVADGGFGELLLERATEDDRDGVEGLVRGAKGLRVGVDGRATDRDELGADGERVIEREVLGGDDGRVIDRETLGADGGREIVRERLGGVNDGLVDREDVGGRAVEREMLGDDGGRATDREKLGGDDGLDGGLATLRDGGLEKLREGALETLLDGVDRETLREGALETLRDGVDREKLRLGVARLAPERDGPRASASSGSTRVIPRTPMMQKRMTWFMAYLLVCGTEGKEKPSKPPRTLSR